MDFYYDPGLLPIMLDPTLTTWDGKLVHEIELLQKEIEKRELGRMEIAAEQLRRANRRIDIRV